MRIYDSENGRVLWTRDMPAGSRGIPAMYEVNGRQFFVVNASSSIVGQEETSAQPDQKPLARAYVAYALPEKGSLK